MLRSMVGALLGVWLSLCLSDAGAQDRSTRMQLLLERLSKSAAPEDYAQIQEAIEASPVVEDELKQLADSGKLNSILVRLKSQCPGCQFGGFENNGQFIFTREFLQALKRNRVYDVVYSDDIAPNNTVFALAHLIHHVKHPVDFSKFSNPTDYSEGRLLVEAECFLVAWNAMVGVAQAANGNKPLSPRQTGQLLVNSRYQFPFVGKSMDGEKLQWLDDGRFAIDAKNKKIVAEVLKTSPMADLR